MSGLHSTGTASQGSFDPRAGARNLLLNCVGVKAGDTVVVAAEDPSFGFYDSYAVDCILDVAAKLGCAARRLACPSVAGPEQLPASVVEAMENADLVIFQARAGDQVRFTSLRGKATKTMSYALDIGFLGSRFCTTPHGLMRSVLKLFEAELDAAGSWRISCPLGTAVSGTRLSAADPGAGSTAAGSPGALVDFSLRLFPVPIFKPVLCGTMNGRVALSRWLMSTANHLYEDSFLELPETVTANVEAGRIRGYDGPPRLVRRIRDHYARVADLFGIDAEVVHSWHAGLHPQAFYPMRVTWNIERWGSVAFANPRYAHFHSCGDYAPGEIAWSIFDADIELDGKLYW